MSVVALAPSSLVNSFILVHSLLSHLLECIVEHLLQGLLQELSHLVGFVLAPGSGDGEGVHGVLVVGLKPHRGVLIHLDVDLHLSSYQMWAMTSP